jgi:replicative DNA helicase
MEVFTDVHTELVLLASMLEYPEAYYQAAAAGLGADDLTGENRAMLLAMQRIAERGESVNEETVLADLQKGENAEGLAALVIDIASPLNMPRRDVSWHIGQVKDKALRRKFVAACEAAIHVAQDGSESGREDQLSGNTPVRFLSALEGDFARIGRIEPEWARTRFLS